MRIGYFGGSFDPPHRGHLAVAQTAAVAFGLDTVLFVPTAHQPLKPEGATARYADRLAMVRLLCEEEGVGGAFVASELEAPRADGRANYTVDTLRELRSTLAPGDEVFVLVGLDAFAELRRWRESEALLELAEWVVVSRPGLALAGLIEALRLSPAQRGRVHVLETVADESSATAIRAALAGGGSCEDSLLPCVVDYIRAHHLYGA